MDICGLCFPTSLDLEPRTTCLATEVALSAFTLMRCASRRFESLNSRRALLLDADAIILEHVVCGERVHFLIQERGPRESSPSIELGDKG